MDGREDRNTHRNKYWSLTEKDKHNALLRQLPFLLLHSAWHTALTIITACCEQTFTAPPSAHFKLANFKRVKSKASAGRSQNKIALSHRLSWNGPSLSSCVYGCRHGDGRSESQIYQRCSGLNSSCPTPRAEPRTLPPTTPQERPAPALTVLVEPLPPLRHW